VGRLTLRSLQSTNQSAPIASVAYCAALGLVFNLSYSAQAATINIWLAGASTLLIVSGSSFAIGGLMGFLFGIPRSLQGVNRPDIGNIASQTGIKPSTKSNEANYQPNTNLEQISDWLTKILVGVGLTQLTNIGYGVSSIAAFASREMDQFRNAEIFVAASILYFGILGFLLGYLWTRLNLAEALSTSDARSQLTQIQMAVEITAAQSRVSGGNIDAASLRQISDIVSTVTPDVMARLQGKIVLWVDDMPEGNIYGRRSLEVMGVSVQSVESTQSALIELQNGTFSAIISDMGRPEGPTAGYVLLESIRKAGVNTPFFIFSRNGSASENRKQAETNGAQGSTNDPKELLRWLVSALST
jgi:CheY-like chemotaxis protein